MEKFKKKVKQHLIMAGIYCVIVVILNVIAVVLDSDNNAVAFALGFSVGIGAVVVFFMVKYLRALKDDEKLKQLYIEETDERRMYIKAKIGGKGMDLTIMFLALSMLISNFFNEVVFFTLFAATMFVVLLKFVLELYYTKKV